jgi:hypothetical protein
MTPGAATLATALEDPNPVNRLRALVILRLTDDGLSRETVMGDLEDLRDVLADEDRDDDLEVVLLIMDQLVGWCNPKWSLTKVASSEYGGR